ncbi:hypothetical protein ACWEQ3_46550 [Streptomyces mirabilis]
MSVFLGNLSRSVAERWAALLALPGMLFVAAATAAHVLGQCHALDAGRLGAWVDRLAAVQGSGRTGITVLVAAGALAASAAAGLCVLALGFFVERLWTATGRSGPLRPLARLRERRWQRAHERVRAARIVLVRSAAPPRRPDPDARAALREALADCARISLVPAARPTWIADRLRAVDLRVHHAYGVDLAAWWPALWLTAADSTRAELAQAGAAYRAGARLTGWGLMYLALGGWWWPSAVAGALTLATAEIRARGAAGTLADLVEAAVHLHGRELAGRLGVETPGRLDRRSGQRVSALLRDDDLLLHDADALDTDDAGDAVAARQEPLPQQRNP